MNGCVNKVPKNKKIKDCENIEFKLSEKTKRDLSEISNMVSDWLESIQRRIKIVSSEIEGPLSKFSEVLESLKGSSLSAEMKDKIIEKATLFASYGIPYPFNEPLGNISKIEVNNEYVLDICEKYSSGEYYEKIKESLHSLKYKNDQQVKE